MSFMTGDFQAETKIEAAARTFGLAQDPARAFVAGDDSVLTHEHLEFGKLYKVTEGIASNRGDALASGQKVHFLGKIEEAESQALHLFFSLPDGTPLDLRFVALAPQEADTRRYLRDAKAILRPALWDASKRGKQLTAARAVLLHLRQQEVST